MGSLHQYMGLIFGYMVSVLVSGKEGWCVWMLFCTTWYYSKSLPVVSRFG